MFSWLSWLVLCGKLLTSRGGCVPVHATAPAGRPVRRRGAVVARTVVAALAASAPWAAQAEALRPSAVRFNRDIRPILSDNCFHCHGPDSANRQADLRLDREEGLFGPRDGGAPVVRGKPDESLIYARVVSSDPDTLMPPVDSHKKLEPEQKELLRRWIQEGAAWEPHWSFVPPKRPELPPLPESTPHAAAWVRNPVDQFILAGLAEAGLEPAPEADRGTLIRRVTLDLTGLPPTPAEVEAFERDERPDAYERLVERLLASPRWGEHRARYWLDAARYGDTHGLHIDNYREMWPYRDWVIGAFNRNLPFDQFTIEQLAGDLLPGATLEQRVASGFHRCNITTNEGGVIPAEVDAMYQKDRVETTGTVWLGLTVQCASCHDHKFDPIVQKEFYQLVAFFKNTTQSPLDGNISDTPPILVVPRPEDRGRWDDLERQRGALVAEKDRLRGAAQPAFSAWLADEATRQLDDPLATDGLDTRVDFREGTGRAVTAHVGGQPRTLTLPETVTWTAGAAPGTKAPKFPAKTALEIPEAGRADADEPLAVALWLWLPPAEESFTVVSQVDPKQKPGTRGWSLDVANRVPSLSLMGDTPADRIVIRGTGSLRLRPGQWNHVCFTYSGKRRVEGCNFYLDGKLQTPQRGDQAALAGSLTNAGPLVIGSTGARDFEAGAIHDLRIYRRAVTPEEIAVLAKWPALSAALAKAPAQLTGPERQDLLAVFLNARHDAYRKASAELVAVEAEREAIRFRGAVTHVMQEKPDGMPLAQVLYRGQYDQPRDEVAPGTPAALHDWPQDAPRNRLGLARWLVDPANPLTARVTVNRFWQELFGTGLVRTSEDFGIMGENPSHPELLDWLAVESVSPSVAMTGADGKPLAARPWDVKRMYRLLVTSAAYRQSAVVSPAARQADPTNRLISRGPRYRMDAEMVRDAALAWSGMLVEKLGGPSVKPYQPEGIWEAVAMPSSNTKIYQADQGEGLYRRSLYTFWKRSAPPALLEIFNAPSRENTCVRRERTNTPLQALATMNDPQFVEAARRLAEQLLGESGSDTASRLDRLTLTVLARRLAPAERKIVEEALADFLRHYRAAPDEARKLIAVGTQPPSSALDPAELAAWTMVANQVMNLDEALCK